MRVKYFKNVRIFLSINGLIFMSYERSPSTSEFDKFVYLFIQNFAAEY